MIPGPRLHGASAAARRWLAARADAVGRGWLLGAACTALAVLAPLVWFFVLALGAGTAHWQHLLAHVLPAATRNTALLLLGVAVWTAVVGVGTAWLVATCDFPGRGVLRWALLLPLAMPTYIVAFVYLDLLHPIGAVQGALRSALGYETPRQFRLPDLRSMGGAIVLLGSVLYPYVYLTTHALFVTQPAHLMEAARSLGRTRWGAFRHAALPMARPALAVGLSLALLETLNDIGASEFLGVPTLTVAVYTTWVTRSDLGGAAQLACAMLGVTVLVVGLERYGRRRQRFGTASRMKPVRPVRLTGSAAWLASAAAALPVLLGFVIPAGYLAHEATLRLQRGHGPSAALWSGLRHSLLYALAATGITVLAGLVVAWAARRVRPSARRPGSALARLASLGYAVPGTVLAIGILGPALAFDAALARLLGLPGLPLLSLGVVLTGAYVLRFLAMPVNGIEAGLERIPVQLEQAARSLGRGPLATLWHVHLPLLRPALVMSALLVLVDAMKELPATLLLRPANVETLATLLYAEAARGTYEDGALAALAIVAAGVGPVIWLARVQLGHLPATAALGESSHPPRPTPAPAPLSTTTRPRGP